MSYEDSGFDAFLSRSIDDLPQASLDSTGPSSTQMRYDSAQLSGVFGDTVRIGKIFLDGKSGRIIMVDDVTNRVLLGTLSDGTQGFAISNKGEDVTKVS